MKVFKFGGASVNSAAAVKNMAAIVEKHIESEPLVVVVSAMGKTTHLLEQLVPEVAPFEEAEGLWLRLHDYHTAIVKELMPDDAEAISEVEDLIEELHQKTSALVATPDQYNRNYDQVVSYGELISTKIIARYLQHIGIGTEWVDARGLIITDSHYREGRVKWELTRGNCQRRYRSMSSSTKLFLTQGFIAGTPEGDATTLGREGSDYTAAILAHCLEAESMTIWKDVPGFLNADPKFFDDTVKIAQIPYNEAIELAYYGASVIHPKTVKPLQNAGIPLYIKSFIQPEAEGSAIGNYHTISPETPLYIVKSNQILLSIAPRDFSFIAEDNLQAIFGILNELGIRMNLMQNSALSFSICIDHHPQRVALLIDQLSHMFHVRYNDNLQLITIRYYTQRVIDSIVDGREVLLEQRSRTTEQIVVKASKYLGKTE